MSIVELGIHDLALCDSQDSKLIQPMFIQLHIYKYTYMKLSYIWYIKCFYDFLGNKD